MANVTFDILMVKVPYCEEFYRRSCDDSVNMFSRLVRHFLFRGYPSFDTFIIHYSSQNKERVGYGLSRNEKYVLFTPNDKRILKHKVFRHFLIVHIYTAWHNNEL